MGGRRSASLRVVAVTAVIGLIAALGASIAGAAPPSGISMQGTGAQPPGLGLFSKAAYAEKGCDATTGRTTLTFPGGGPFCVNPWPAGKNNGGATAPGVTATEVHVIAYVPNDQMSSDDPAARVNQATGGKAAWPDIITDWGKAYSALQTQMATYQTWGRKPVVETYVASGPDEAAQRADALDIISKKPFMVVDLTASASGGAQVLSDVLAAKKIIVVSPSTDAKNSIEQAPYRYNFGADSSAGPAITAALVGKVLSGGKAQYAGDALKTKTRSFGMIYPTTGFDEPGFEKYLTQNGGKLTDKASYDSSTSTVDASQIGTVVSKLKASGVTSVILFAAPTITPTITKAATDQNWFPEWVFTGYAYQEYGAFARENDPQQMAHAFGTMYLGPYLQAPPGSPSLTGYSPFTWYWGTQQGNTSSTASVVYGDPLMFMHYAGPTLTAANVKKGLFAAPAYLQPGAGIGLAGFGKTVGLPYDEYSASGSDRALAWWDGNTTGPSNATGSQGKGVWQYLNNGVNMKYAQFQTLKNPKLFDASASVVIRDPSEFYPGGKLPTTLPCSGCPASGGSPSSS
jgi:hypothetical protein